MVSLIMSTSSSLADGHLSLSFSPASARLMLVDHLSSKYPRSIRLVLEAIWRVIGLSESLDVVHRTDIKRKLNNAAAIEEEDLDLRLPPVSQLLEKASYTQNVVFEEEKQNLFLDPVTEAESWAQVLVNIPSEIWPYGLKGTLRTWTHSGLECLSSALDKCKDSSLGFTSKADIYALFMHSILMARILVVVPAGDSKKFHDPRTDGERESTIQKLEDFYKQGQRRDLHPLILDRVARVLEEVGRIVD